MHDHIKTKATCIANQDKRKKSNKPIRSRSIQLQVGPSAGNCEQENWRYGREAIRSTAWPSATKPEIVQNSTNKRKKQNKTKQRGTTKRRWAKIVLICLKHVPNQWCIFARGLVDETNSGQYCLQRFPIERHNT